MSSRIACVRSGSVMAVDSVISTVSRAGSIPAGSRREMTLSTTSGCQSCLGERLKLISSESPSARHSASCRLSSSTTQSPIASIRPISSARGMNSPGWISPPPGSGHRINASTPIIPPVASSMSGW